MKNSFLKTVIKVLICSVIAFLLFWFNLPAINLRNPGFYRFLIEIVITVAIVFGFSGLIDWLKSNVKAQGSQYHIEPKKIRLSTYAKVFGGIIAGSIVLLIIGSVIGAAIFNADKYKSLITYTEGDFSEDIAELSMNQIPVVDRDTAQRLGKRKLGEMSDLVSQFEIADNYTQINYKGSPYRVTLLRYGDAIKWLNNQNAGIPAYILVNMTTQDTSLVRLKDGIKYSESEYFMRNINRALRFKYPTKIFEDIVFEIDENGTPYWIAPTVSYRIGLFSGADISGAVLLNAITGESKYYDLEAIPSWVDQIFVSDMIINQLNYNGLYQSGYWNSIFGQKGVLTTTEGYNYIAVDDDVYLYTGMTSVVGDESNVGFVLVNMRTKETKFYSVPGAEEYSAMDSARGQVQQMNYTSTFPILLNIANRPTYFMSLKDSAGLVKMYAFVDVEQYQVVGTGSTVADAKVNYEKALYSADVEIEAKNPVYTEVSGTVAEIHGAVVNGNTVYYFMISGDDTVYSAEIGVSKSLPFLKAGDNISFTHSEAKVKEIK